MQAAQAGTSAALDALERRLEAAEGCVQVRFGCQLGRP